MQSKISKIRELIKLKKLHDCRIINWKGLSKFQVVCACGSIKSSDFSRFRKFPSCAKCYRKRQKLPNHKIREIFQSKNCELLDNEDHYLTDKVKYRCSCGFISTKSASNFKRNSGCNNCRSVKCVQANTIHYSEIKNRVESFGEYKLITAEEEYNKTSDILTIECLECCRRHKKTISNFMNWRGCSHNGNRNNPNLPKVNHNKSMKLKTNDVRKFNIACRTLVYRTLNAFLLEKSDKTKNILGYYGKELMDHITSNTRWKILKDQEWCIDHIFPVKAFLDYGIYDVKLLNSLNNLQLLSRSENLKKNASYDRDAFENWLKDKGYDLK